WILAEFENIATDSAEVTGSAIALNLLFGMPRFWGVCITALDIFLVLFLQHKGFRYIEVIVITLMVTILVC
ncbi:divalent metal cation transporter, partial [Escherichia coli]|nr:divalent metal cation transporter [Escherichia coli]